MSRLTLILGLVSALSLSGTVLAQSSDTCCITDELTGDVSCAELDAAACTTAGGTSHSGTSCTDHHLCSFPDGTCQDLPSCFCVKVGGTPGLGRCISCCITDELTGDVSCAELDAAACTTAGGTSHSGTSCTDHHLCSFPDGTCQDLPSCSCVRLGGTPGLGRCISCCLAGGCENYPSEQACSDVGGTPLSGTSCGALNACCLPDDGTCVDRLACDCEGLGGVSSLGSCSRPVACCQPGDASCTLRDPICCDLEGGTAYSNDSCGTPQACCFETNGNQDAPACQNLDPCTCADQGGMPTGGSCELNCCGVESPPNFFLPPPLFSNQADLCNAFHGFTLAQVRPDVIPPPPVESGQDIDRTRVQASLADFVREGVYKQLGWLHDRNLTMSHKYQGFPPFGVDFSRHHAVKVYYSPEVIEWLCNDRRGKCGNSGQLCDSPFDCGGADCVLLPRGAMLVQEEQVPVTSIGVDPTDQTMSLNQACYIGTGNVPRRSVMLTSGIRIDDTGVLFNLEDPGLEPWFWAEIDVSAPDPLTSPMNCTKCHAGAFSAQTFATLDNITPGDITHLFQAKGEKVVGACCNGSLGTCIVTSPEKCEFRYGGDGTDCDTIDPPCCFADEECVDTDICTDDACVDFVCRNVKDSDCCRDASECEDSDDCTTDTCVNNVCVNEAITPCCGNGAVEGTEECDGTAGTCPGGLACQSDCTCTPEPVGCCWICDGSTLSCDGPIIRDNCSVPNVWIEDESCGTEICGTGQCEAPPICGDDMVNQPGEQCDGSDAAACPGQCRSDCTCPPQPVCGDNLVNRAGEECDGTDDDACPGECRSSCLCPSEGAVPTVSTWGIAIMALMLLIGAKVYFSRRRRAMT